MLKKTFSYNKNKQLLRVCFFDSNGKPVPNEEGASEIIYTYNNKGEKVDESFWNAGHLVNTIYGYAKIKMTYDAKGLLMQEEFQNTQESSVESKKTADQCAIKSYTYGLEGELLAKRRLDIQQKVMEEVKYEYDGEKNMTKETCYDAHGKLLKGIDKHYAQKTMEYGKQGRIAIERYKDEYGKTGDLSVGDCGQAVAQRRYLYDENGVCSSTVHLHPDGSFCSER